MRKGSWRVSFKFFRKRKEKVQSHPQLLPTNFRKRTRTSTGKLAHFSVTLTVTQTVSIHE
jgi:hypothetical protein